MNQKPERIYPPRLREIEEFEEQEMVERASRRSRRFIGFVVMLALLLLIPFVGQIFDKSGEVNQVAVDGGKGDDSKVAQSIQQETGESKELSGSNRSQINQGGSPKVETALPVNTRANRRTSLPPGNHIQVEVRNGCGLSGAALVVAGRLQREGFDVPSVGNASELKPHTLIIDRVGDTMAINYLRKSLDLPETQVIRQIDSSKHVSATVIIGQDYNPNQHTNP